MAYWLKSSRRFSQGSAALKEVSQVGNQTAWQGDEEGAIENERGDHSDDRHGFLTSQTMLSLLVNRPGVKSDIAGLTHTQEATSKEL